MPLAWTKALETGFADIDEQHKELFSRIDAFVKAMMSGKDSAEVNKIISFLEEYTEVHFSAEEKLLEKNGYPLFQAHKAHHEYFRRSVASAKTDYNAHGAVRNVTESIHKNVTGWLVSHIQKQDMAWAAFLKTKH